MRLGDERGRADEQLENQQLQIQTIEALRTAWYGYKKPSCQGMTFDQLQLLCWHCGIKYQEVLG